MRKVSIVAIFLSTSAIAEPVQVTVSMSYAKLKEQPTCILKTNDNLSPRKIKFEKPRPYKDNCFLQIPFSEFYKTFQFCAPASTGSEFGVVGGECSVSVENGNVQFSNAPNGDYKVCFYACLTKN